MIKQFSLKLVDAWMLASTCRHLVFERTDGEPFVYVPGQFIQIHFPGEDKMLRRSYSVATVPDSVNDDGQASMPCVEMAVSYVEGGAATALLSGLSVGDEITASGPYGRFCLADDEHQRTILVATGTGVTPYRAMLPQIESRCAVGREFVVLYGAQSPEFLYYDDEFREFAGRHAGFQYLASLSRTPRDKLLACDRTGRVQQQFDELDLIPDQDLVFLCGNPNMIDEAFSELKELGFPVPSIRREKYISPK